MSQTSLNVPNLEIIENPKVINLFQKLVRETEVNKLGKIKNAVVPSIKPEIKSIKLTPHDSKKLYLETIEKEHKDDIGTLNLPPVTSPEKEATDSYFSRIASSVTPKKNEYDGNKAGISPDSIFYKDFHSDFLDDNYVDYQAVLNDSFLEQYKFRNDDVDFVDKIAENVVQNKMNIKFGPKKDSKKSEIVENKFKKKKTANLQGLSCILSNKRKKPAAVVKEKLMRIKRYEKMSAETETPALEKLKIEDDTSKGTPEDAVTFEANFKNFAKFGDPKSDGKQITLSNSDKWMKQAKIIDGKKITTTDTGIYFKKLKSQKVTVTQYKTFLEDLAKAKKIDSQEIIKKLSQCGAPGLHGVGNIKATETVNRLTDTTKYTGTHKQRFDETGKGKGIAGRKEILDTSGYVAGYQNKDSYDGKEAK